MKHSILPPSSASRRVACPGSRALEARYPELEESIHAKEGEAAHWVASSTLKDHNFKSVINQIAPNGELITEEMLEGAKLYSDYVLRVVDELFGYFNVSKVHIEEQIDISIIYPDCFGTPDCWTFYKNCHGFGQLHIWDYKFGHGFVEVFENWQLIEYAAGILDQLKLSEVEKMLAGVTFYIVQPRSYHPDGKIRTWKIMVSDLEKYFNRLKVTEAKAMSSEAKCQPTSECGYCLGRHACEALQRSSLNAIDLSTQNSPLELTSQQVGSELRYLRHAAELLDARISGLSEQALSLLKKGHRVTHFKLEESAGRDRWKVPAEEIIILGEIFEKTLAKPTEVVTPKQAVKMGIPEYLVKAFVDVPKVSLKLVPDNNIKSRKIFSGG